MVNNEANSSTSVKKLFLNSNKIGDAGMTAFAGAIGTSGALGQLTQLGLGSNQIGDEGMKMFSAAIGNGALPALETVYLFNNPGDDAAVEKALADRKS